MKLIEEKRDLFSVDVKYYFAHCISDDLALGAGIAVEFQRRFDLREKLKTEAFTRSSQNTSRKKSKDYYFGGVCAVLINKVFNLITKESCYHKPTYATLRQALIDMKQQMINENIQFLAIPKIGCGLDRLEWDTVKNMLITIFDGTDVEILVCYL